MLLCDSVSGEPGLQLTLDKKHRVIITVKQSPEGGIIHPDSKVGELCPPTAQTSLSRASEVLEHTKFSLSYVCWPSVSVKALSDEVAVTLNQNFLELYPSLYPSCLHDT